MRGSPFCPPLFLEEEGRGKACVGVEEKVRREEEVRRDVVGARRCARGVGVRRRVERERDCGLRRGVRRRKRGLEVCVGAILGVWCD